jgi:Recombination endonuclease VII
LPKKTHCKRGHPLSGDNLYVSPQGIRYCRLCSTARTQRWYQKQDPLLRRQAHRESLWKFYGIKNFTTEDYNRLLMQQNQLCALCGKLNTEKKPFVPDHDHLTGRVRGLIHDSCNRLLGAAGDSADRLEEAALYLRTS